MKLFSVQQYRDVPLSADGYFVFRLQVAFVEMKKVKFVSLISTGVLQSRINNAKKYDGFNQNPCSGIYV